MACSGFQFNARNTLGEEATVDPTLMAIHQFDALARIKVIESAVVDKHLLAVRGRQSRQSTHHPDIRKTHGVFGSDIFQFHPRPIMRELITKQINRVIGTSFKSKPATVNTQACRLVEIHFCPRFDAQVTAFDHSQRLVYQIDRIMPHLGQHQ